MTTTTLRRLRPGRFALPATVLLVYLYILAPVMFVAWIAFFDQDIIVFPPEGYTLKWFAQVWERRAYQRGFVTSFQVAAVAMVFGVALGTLASIALVRYRFPGREAINTLLLSPLIVPGIVAGTAIYVFFVYLDNTFEWEMKGTLPGLVAAHVMLTLPWTVRLISASLQGIDRAVEEAAANLGANPWTVFRRVTFPMMRAGIVAAALFSFITSFENLELTLFLVGPGRTTLPVVVLAALEFKVDPTIAAVAFVQIVIIGAHYDSREGTPGADDNASGTAAVLALARRYAKEHPARTVRFLLFPNEEYFRQDAMGSVVYARLCRSRNEDVVAMVSVETIGYFSDAAGSQQYPFPVNLLYPDRGSFIGFVGNLASRELVREALGAFRKGAGIGSEGVAAPESVEGVDWSDHWSFWREGYPGIMITDTAPFRNPNYHRATDVPDTLDYHRMARVVSGLARVVRELGSPE